MATTVTRRASSPQWTDATSRIPLGLLALEGDESGILVLSGDARSATVDGVRLEGDEARTVGGTTTKRVAGAVS